MSLAALFETLKSAAKADLKSPATAQALRDIIAASLVEVANSETAPLISKVAGKTYSMRVRGARTSRPVNIELFRPDLPLDELFGPIFATVVPTELELLDQCLYTAAMAFPVARDLVSDGDKKSPGTFFELFVGHIVAARYGVHPKTSITVPTLDTKHTIPTDFIFELPNDRRLHVPVKISTRERVVQVWAHQRLLDGMHGVGRFRGLLVCLTETNKQKNTSVVEVCLPLQWAAYQLYIAKLDRVYYLDPPAKYLALRDTFPHIQVWPLSRFYVEAADVLSPAWV